MNNFQIDKEKFSVFILPGGKLICGELIFKNTQSTGDFLVGLKYPCYIDYVPRNKMILVYPVSVVLAEECIIKCIGEITVFEENSFDHLFDLYLKSIEHLSKVLSKKDFMKIQQI